MKKVIKIIVCCLLISPAFSQQKDSLFHLQDSARVIDLGETVVTGYSKNQNQCLHHFYKGNTLNTTEDVLARLPEISLIRRGSYGMEPTIRAYNSSQSSILLDGMQIHGACTDKMDPVTIYIEPSNLKNIQLQSNNGFVSGSNIGGTLNMQLAQPELGNDKIFSGIISSGYQSSANALYENAVLHYSKEKWAVRANVTYRKNENYKDGNGKTVDYSQYEKANYSLSVKFKIKKDWLGKIDMLADEGWNIGYAALPMDVGYAGAKIFALSVLKEPVNKKWERVEMKLYGNIIKHYMDDTQRKEIAMHMDMPGLSRTKGGYIDAKYRLNNKQLFLLRADLSSTFLKASMTMYQPSQPDMYMLTWPDNRKIQCGASAVYQYKIDSATQLNLSSRIDAVKYSLLSKTGKDQLSVFNYSTADKLYLLKNISGEITRKLAKKIQTGFSISYSERVASANELYGYYLFNNFDGYDYIGNPGLKNENSFKAEANVLVTSSRVRFMISGYAAKINHYIIGTYDPSLSSMTIGANGVKVYENIPSATIAGIEASVYYKPSAATQIVSVVKYAYGADKDNVPLQLIAPLKNITSIRRQINKFSVQLESEIAAQQNKVRKSVGEMRTAGYFVSNFRASYSGSLNKYIFQIDAGVENVFNAAYKEHLDWGNIYRPGRNLFLHCSISF